MMTLFKKGKQKDKASRAIKVIFTLYPYLEWNTRMSGWDLPHLRDAEKNPLEVDVVLW